MHICHIDRTAVWLCLRQNNQAENEFSGPPQRVLMMLGNVLLRSLLFRRFSWDVSTAGIHTLPGKRRHSQQGTTMLVCVSYFVTKQRCGTLETCAVCACDLIMRPYNFRVMDENYYCIRQQLPAESTSNVVDHRNQYAKPNELLLRYIC